MVVNKLFGEVKYPDNNNDKRKIVEEYNKKLKSQVSKEASAKDFKMSLLFESIMILSTAFVFMYGDVSILLKLLYILPTIAFTVYDFYLLCKVKKEDYCNEKNLYKKYLSQLFVIVLLMYVGTYIFAVVSLGDKLTTGVGFALWGMFIILSIAFLLKAAKDSPSKFLNKYLDPKSKIHKQPSWALNITRIIIILVCIYKPYMLLMGATFIVITPLIYAISFSYYVYLQYDKIQELMK